MQRAILRALNVSIDTHDIFIGDANIVPILLMCL